jgi:hypothetical protein
LHVRGIQQTFDTQIYLGKFWYNSAPVKLNVFLVSNNEEIYFGTFIFAIFLNVFMRIAMPMIFFEIYRNIFADGNLQYFFTASVSDYLWGDFQHSL